MRTLHLAQYTSGDRYARRIVSTPRAAADFIREHMTPGQFAQCREVLGAYAEGRHLAVCGSSKEHEYSIERVEADVGLGEQ